MTRVTETLRALLSHARTDAQREALEAAIEAFELDSAADLGATQHTEARSSATRQASDP